MKNPLRDLGVSDKALLAAIAGDAKAHQELKRVGAEVAEDWKGRAPVFGDKDPRRADPPYGGEPGEYRDSIEPGKPHVNKEGELELLVESDDYKAIEIELGSKHMPVYAPATATMRQFGAEDGPIITNSTNRPEVEQLFRKNRRDKAGGKYGARKRKNR
ncbi:Uncharacterised protein [Mycobacteroides abscessus subsp. abscessus]|uniref:hypothetical protein n=1 Tax=Mycobacteroides abscessus TaxID=36809 RepID=UPI00092B4D6D|nr:hypothetical protein [Mycobacteroides abscessus]SIC56456.1 Uncharacterised protein [Mycobacteroides abscessus subsp. abscessus]SKU57686.1 Uncharacterised protein [Mycobacteroides abscessus subsp. abscessus]